MATGINAKVHVYDQKEYYGKSVNKAQRFQASLGEISAYGATASEATDNLANAIDTALHCENNNPVVLAFRGETIVVYRTIAGDWGYYMMHDGIDATNEVEQSYRYSTVFGYATRSEAVRHARRHLASLAWNGVELTSPVIFDPDDQDDFTWDCNWQLAYKKHFAETGDKEKSRQLANADTYSWYVMES